MSAQDVEATASGDESGSKTELKELRRNFNFWSLCGVGLMTGSTWLPLGGSIVSSSLALPEASAHSVRLSCCIMAAPQVPSTSCKSIIPHDSRPFPDLMLIRTSIATSVFYWMIAACIAELASAIPSSAGGKYQLLSVDQTTSDNL